MDTARRIRVRMDVGRTSRARWRDDTKDNTDSFVRAYSAGSRISCYVLLSSSLRFSRSSGLDRYARIDYRVRRGRRESDARERERRRRAAAFYFTEKVNLSIYRERNDFSASSSSSSSRRCGASKSTKELDTLRDNRYNRGKFNRAKRKRGNNEGVNLENRRHFSLVVKECEENISVFAAAPP